MRRANESTQLSTLDICALAYTFASTNSLCSLLVTKVFGILFKMLSGPVTFYTLNIGMQICVEPCVRARTRNDTMC